MKRRLLLIVLASFMVLPLAAQKGGKRDVKQLEAELSSTRDSLAIALQECNLLVGKLSALDTLRSLAGRSMLQEFSSYSSRAFADIDSAVVDSLQYIGKRLLIPEVDALLADLDTAMRHSVVYRMGYHLLEMEYDKEALDSALTVIGGIKERCSALQQAELEDIAKRMALYPTAMERAFVVAEWMEDTLKDIRAEGNPASVPNAVALANSIFNNQEYEYQTFIAKVPYMDRLYKAYKKAILENPLQVGPEEQQLLTYKY